MSRGRTFGSPWTWLISRYLQIIGHYAAQVGAIAHLRMGLLVEDSLEQLRRVRANAACPVQPHQQLADCLVKFWQTEELLVA